MSKSALIGLGLGLIILASGCSALNPDSSDQTAPAKTNSEAPINQVETGVEILPAE